ncbi:DNA (Cytosine-5)-methyltransferase DRM2-like protein [Melia azedarach]|uniref:DNA (Cytosine-5)-methyltransferase DRM2-like protein n=2 Tax=Melia azedarach TaxID=155640 RepID=A0ACC1YET8_MELAZ|nr:DNA (Cytosine-5)-methyltransferase DRM2-like protein [Melia azedarach]KAJ4721932.1 DNA (Cytosine-5)-methyltransferase DRM2-like protein [Melia azedarach]
MSDIPSYGNGENQHEAKAIVPKPEILNFELPEDRMMYSTNVGDNAAGSSRSSLRSSLIGMGFAPSLVDRAIEEKGEDDVELLLETLIGYNDPQKSNSQSSDSLDSLFGDKDTTSPPEIPSYVQPKEEPDIMNESDNDAKRASLLTMKFTVNEVDFALDKLGKDAPIDELVDFIIAAQIAENFEKETDNTPHYDGGTLEDSSDETLFGTMDITLHLLEMGFSEYEVSLAIEKFGSDAPISELADKIFSGQIHLSCPRRSRPYGSLKVKAEDFSPDVSQSRKIYMGGTKDFRPDVSQPRKIYMGGTKDFRPDVSQPGKIGTDETNRGKRPKEEYFNDFPAGASQFQHIDLEDNRKGKRPKQEYVDDPSSFLDSSWLEEKVNPNNVASGVQQVFISNPCKSTDKVVAKPPYFFYGNVVNISGDCWMKISQFLYGLGPEFVNAQNFSALSRKEGYVHNLPTSNRFHILPKPPMTIQDAIPHTKKWWPSWDTRKQLSCINSGTSGTSQLCDRLEKLLIDSRGVLSSQQQSDILHRCETLNLLWVGLYKLGPVDCESLEHILGYPVNHTQAAGSSLTPRLESLRHCFQIDTLGYHLSALKSMFPEGLTMLSVFGGIGGAEVALHRLGIKLKGVISVETSEANRRILRRWWEGSGQTGELVQLEDVLALTTKKVDSLIEKFGSIDFVICQNSVPQSSKHPTAAAGIDNLPAFDFSLFYEFVRVLQRVRNMMQRKRYGAYIMQRNPW